MNGKKLKPLLKISKNLTFINQKNYQIKILNSIGLVAAFDNFYADICLSEISLY